MTTTSVDLSNCDQEPIHIPGAIQPHGCLLACSGDYLNIVYWSDNAPRMLTGAQRDFSCLKLRDFLRDDLIHDIRNAAATSNTPSIPGLIFGARVDESSRLFDITIHHDKDLAIIEFEPVSAQATRTEPISLMRELVLRLGRATSVAKLCVSAARFLRALTRYDRVMVYRFLHDGAGRVIAEDRRVDLNSFLNQHFPAADIPAQARTLYRNNWIRQISDVAFTPCLIEPQGKERSNPIDLSHAHLRSVSPIHCEYLTNMGVSASMSISILVDGTLWGLIACHHYAPKTLTMAERVSCELFGRFLSLQIEAIGSRERFEKTDNARALLDRFVADLPAGTALIETLGNRLDKLSELVTCDGVGLWMNGNWQSYGSVPETSDILPLARMIDSLSDRQVWASHSLSSVHQQAANYVAQASGVLAIPLSHSGQHYLMFFRKEVIRTVDWGGDPEKSVTRVGSLGDRLTPRKSFEIWKESVRAETVPWSSTDLAIGEAIRMGLLEIVLRHNETMIEERTKAEHQQRILNEELSHRVKNILALIKSLITRGAADGMALSDYAKTLEGRISALAMAHNQIARDKSPGTIRQLMEAELAPYSDPGNPSVFLNGPSIGLEGRALVSLALVVHEMATNAAKYGALSVASGEVHVHWMVNDNDDCRICWEEQGGPAVEDPEHRGFGSTLIERSIPHDLQGTAVVDFRPSGLRVELTIPARYLTEASPANGNKRTDRDHKDRSDITGLRVLIVEDELVIAMDVEDMLKAAGATTVQTCATVEEALSVLETSPPDIAVLDVNLGATTSMEVAESLVSQDIPFIFATGYGDSLMIPSAFKKNPVVRKPYTTQALESAMQISLQQNNTETDTSC